MAPESGGAGFTPPRAWEALLRRALPKGTVGRSILGDLREEHGRRAAASPADADGWYGREAFSILLLALRDRLLGRWPKDRHFKGPLACDSPWKVGLVLVNFWEYNAHCAETDVTGMHAALEAHEYQHFLYLEQVASLPENDPRSAIENIVALETSDANLYVHIRVHAIKLRLDAVTQEPPSTYTSGFWIWESGQVVYKLFTV